VREECEGDGLRLRSGEESGMEERRGGEERRGEERWLSVERMNQCLITLSEW